MRTFKSVISAVVFVLAGVSANASTVQNGSFETIPSSLNGSGWRIFNSLDGWATAPNVEIQTEKTLGLKAQDGFNYVELNTDRNAGIYQDLSLTAGAYELSFWYSPRVNKSPTDTNDMKFEISGTSVLNSPIVSKILGAPSLAYPHGKWTEVTADFTVSQDSTVRLYFGATGEVRTNGCGYCGALIDNVQVSAVPIPAGMVLLLTGLGAFGAARRWRKA